MKEQHVNPYWVATKGPYMIESEKVIHLFSPEEDEVPRVCPSQTSSAQRPPIPLIPLIGREREVEFICALLQRSWGRLVTLTGPGGVGKTSLALQIAAEMRSAFADGVCFVSLASASTSDQVLAAIARAFGLKPDQRSLARLHAVLRDRQCLLVLDNFEQVAGAAPQLKKLLTMSPGLKILITSRTVLRLLEEQVFYVAPLALPDPSSLPACKDLAQVAAVALFVQRTRGVRPDFALTDENARAVAQICARLDGLPLALELAAARMKLFSPQGLLERLDCRLSFLTDGPCDAPQRQQTLRKTMEWSYQLLTPEEQRLFRLLSVFAGGCSLHAIEAISGTEGEREPLLLDTLTSLLDHSLLQREDQTGNEEHRFTMLETIREYAWECLQSSNEVEAICQAHAEYYVKQIRAIELKEMGGTIARWIACEFDNLRVAFDWFLLSYERMQMLDIHSIEARSPLALAVCLVIMGMMLALRKRFVWATRLWGKAQAIYRPQEQYTVLEPCVWLTDFLGSHTFSSQMLEIVQTWPGEQEFTAAWNEGHWMELEPLLAGTEPVMIAASPEKVAVPCLHGLTARERDVLRLLTQGLSSALIAEQLFISLTTVNSHVRTIYNKLGVSSRSAATRYALEHHLV